MVKKVAIVGGTHGNELTGVYLVKKWQKDPSQIKRSNFETITLLANPKAVKLCRRYVEKDLNRSFSIQALSKPDNKYESKRAVELNAKLGPKGAKSTNVDFILDLHTTTANMGLSLVVSSQSELTWKAVKYLCAKEPSLKVYRWRGDEEDSFVDSIVPNGFAIEVGPIPQGVLRSDLFFKTQTLTYHLLDFFQKLNDKKELSECERKIEIYDHVKLIDYPRDENGEIAGLVHHERQDRDFEPVKKGDPLFETFDKRTISYEDDEELYALFINEAAYYEKGFAMTLAKKMTL